MGLVVFCAVLTGVVLGRIFATRSDEAESLALSSSSGIRPEKAAAAAASVVTSFSPANPLLEATMNGMREGMLVVDQEMRIAVANRAAREMFSHVQGALERKRLSDLTRNPAIHSAFITALNRKERAEAKVEMQVKDNRTFDLRVVPLRLDEESNTQGALGVFFDITRLERLERVRQEFLSNVSHELRTPLTAIIAYIETLEDGALDDLENNKRFLAILRRNAERMHSLINDILELSAIEAGTVQVNVEAVPLRSMVNHVLTALASRAGARQVSLRNDVTPECVVQADGRRLEQMLTNLIDNAIKFNREGGSVTIRQDRQERDRISVMDTGDGIPPEHIKRIFERFYRVDRARSRDMGGTGLGLAIVKHLARAHGGEVSVYSEFGEGATFVIELPVEQLEESENQLLANSNAELRVDESGANKLQEKGTFISAS